MSADLLKGEPVASEIRADVRDRVRTLAERDVTPTLATVLLSDDAAQGRFMELKHEACHELGIATRGLRLDPGVDADRLHQAVEERSSDPDVDAVFVQTPLPDHISLAGVRERIDPTKDVDCFHPTNLGRLVAGDPRFEPATPAAVRRVLEWYDYSVAGRNVTVVGRSAVIGRPLANMLLQRSPDADATVTVSHSHTADLAAHTRRADVLVTICGRPHLVDGSMLSPGTVVVDVSANRRETAHGVEVVGDVEFPSARKVAAAITPVPGGVGPVTVAMLLENVVLASERRHGSVTDLGP